MSIHHSHKFKSAYMKFEAINFIHNGTFASSCLEPRWISYSTPMSVAEPRVNKHLYSVWRAGSCWRLRLTFLNVHTSQTAVLVKGVYEVGQLMIVMINLVFPILKEETWGDGSMVKKNTCYSCIGPSSVPGTTLGSSQPPATLAQQDLMSFSGLHGHWI